MFRAFVCRVLGTKKLLPVLGILCLVVVVFDFIMLTRVKEFYLSRTYRKIETASHTFSTADGVNNRTQMTQITQFADDFNRTNSFKTLPETENNYANLSKYTSKGSNNASTFENFNQNYYKTVTALPVTSVEPGRPESCTDCFKHEFSLTIDNEEVCKIRPGNTKQEITILILIFTSHARRGQRDAIRQTWLTHAKNNTANIRYVFLLGISNQTNLNQAVLEENKLHADLIQENFTDSYLNLTYKTMMGFKWALTHCAHAKFVLKTDDDMYVNIPVLINLTRTNAEHLQTAVGGSCFVLDQQPIRDKYSKWYASYTSYPQELYPGFCSGTGYITSIAVVKHVFDISKNVPFFHLEDIYVSLCLKQLGYHLLPLYGFHNHRVRIDFCHYKSAFVVTSHELSPDLLRSVWTGTCKPYNLQMRIMGFVVAMTFFIILCLCSMVQ
ncbi:beta-1,3-galactosyltransferase 5-like [Mizuhopecten yessoensis]|uniref:Hexosyltransferase n=1 Tax=Mizuhopecten yessoensis TaxID=6573 RepID=A0A210QRY0_MIZYE|nr:beta-1,3-galactosyltransferase 5-like [Mizuhopecten yessoensis]XP_021351336.1 beta-1,3-galactosyltransferase 5-like [Mizuhopecten yessoensis]XP_021351337.1 beta-1,3-galactosyltransferase 5-like [Mizuhopecten yessoensis]OWF51503.1 Beta-1,3-galactosyltransferase 1 [Mizuhopecten yessoensis]